MYENLAEYFEKKKNIKIFNEIGKKQPCPECTKNTFCLYYDNGEKAKCFHPDCQKHFNLNLINYGFNYIAVVAEEIYQDYKQFLLQNTGHMPYQYLISRGIDPFIIERSELGAVPENYDSDRIFNRIIDEIEEKINNNDSAEKNKAKLKEIKELKTEFKEWAKQNAGNLCFFYRDKYGYITQIRARKPHKKKFTTCKFSDKVGIFNAQPLWETDDFDNKLFVTEGEFNTLQLLTVCLDNLKSIHSCAVGAASSVDYETLFIQDKDIVIIYDNDDAGIQVLIKAREVKGVYGVTTPERGSDLDEYLKSFDDKKKAFSAFRELISRSKKYFRSLKGIKNQVKEVLNQKMKVHEKKETIAELIVKEIQERYTFYRDHNFLYLFSEETKRIIELSLESQELRLLFTRMGVNPSETLYKYVFEELVSCCHQNAIDVEIHKYAYYDYKNFTLYLYNNRDKVFKITRDEITPIQNGDDGVLFVYDRNIEPFEIVEIDKNIDYLGEFISTLNFDSEEVELGLLDQKNLFRYWFLSTFFESIMSTKVIMLLIGEKGSGKTYSVKTLGKILFGSKYQVTPMPSKPDDFDTVVSNTHYCVFDNADNTHAWLNDKLACVATGGTIKKRKLYTTNEAAELSVKCFLALTSREPNFNRDDVADRLICLNFKRRDGFTREHCSIQEILDNRNKIITGIIFELQDIIKALYAKRKINYVTEFRIADFAVFGLIISDYKNKKGEFEQTLKKLMATQTNFTLENDPLVEVLRIWLHCNNCINIGREVTGNELFKDLKQLAKIHVPSFNYKSVKSTMLRLRNIRDDIQELITYEKDIRRSNIAYYKFYLHDVEEGLKKYTTPGGDPF